MADTLTVSDLQKLQELQKEVNAIREQLKPKYEAIQKKVQVLDVKDDIKFLMDFEGKPIFKTNVEWDGQAYEVVFKLKKVG
jgi:hypothetical protein